MPWAPAKYRTLRPNWVSQTKRRAKIAQLLPGIIDHLTPNGQMPASGSNILEMGQGLLKDFMKPKDQQ
jgi:hypothetical protein